MTTSIALVGPRHNGWDEMIAHLSAQEMVLSFADSLTPFLRRPTAPAWMPPLATPALMLLSDRIVDTTVIAALDALSKSGVAAPVIVLGERADDVEKIICLELGAEDYVDFPCNPRELSSRIRNILRHRPPRAQATGAPHRLIRFGRFTLDRVNRVLSRQGAAVPLQGSALALLQLFAEQPMKVMTRAALIASMERRGSGHSERSLDVLVCRLRNVIEAVPARPRIIQTVRGHGYVFNPLGEGDAGACEGSREHEDRAFAHS